MTEEKKIVEVTVTTDEDEQVPVGIMNAKQALSLPDDMDVAVSHPDREVGSAQKFIDREELRALTEPWVVPVGIRFPAPIGDEAVDRFDEAKAVARNVLQEIVASAIEAGWSMQEITVALIEAARSLEKINEACVEGAEHEIDDAVREQIGHGEQFD